MFVFTAVSASFAQNSRIDEKLAWAREGVYPSRVQGTVNHTVGIALPIESRTASSADIYISDKDLYLAWIGLSCNILVCLNP